MIGGNKSAESYEEESADASTSGVDIVLQNRLAWVDMDKKKYQKYIKAYVAKLVEKLTETKPDYVATFKKKAIPAVKRILDNFEEWDFYRGETDFEGANGMLCILGYREDQTTPYLLFFKDGLLEEKVVGFLFAWYERSTLKDFSRYYANDILSLNLEKIWKIVTSTAFWDSKGEPIHLLELDHGHSCIESWSRNHQRLTKLHKPIVQVQLVVLKKLTSADLSQMAQRKSCALLVISST